MSECVIVIFGASGDLAKRKLFPALYRLHAKGFLRNYALVGVAYDDTDVATLLEKSKVHIPNVDATLLQQLQDRTSYYKLDFTQPEGFVRLAQHVAGLEKKYGLSGNRLFYCATAAQFFCPITHQIAQSGLGTRKSSSETSWCRLVYEKPFGHDVASAHEINACIAQYFDETQVYRIDHYLTKEIVGNIALMRFTNCVFEPLWNNRYIDHVQIIVSETVGIEGRGAYYDAYGALKDVVQNHVLELMALIGMESPDKLTGEYIRAQRAKVLAHVEVIDVLLGQFEGYHQEPMVKQDSLTETFACAAVRIKNNRWAGVPFYIKTGKCLDKKETVIHIKFKKVDCLLVKNCPNDSNYLTIRVAPDATFFLHLNGKKPGVSDEIMPINMEFCHSCLFGQNTPEAYEVLYEEVLRGEHSVSVRFDEIESAWKIIEAMKAQDGPVYPYKRGSVGPTEMENFCKKHGFRWRS